MTLPYVITKGFDPMEQSDRAKLPLFFADVAKQIKSGNVQIVSAAAAQGQYRLKASYIQEYDANGDEQHQFYPYEGEPGEDYANLNDQLVNLTSRINLNLNSSEFVFFKEPNEAQVPDGEWHNLESGREFVGAVFRYMGREAWLCAIQHSDLGHYLANSQNAAYSYEYDADNSKVMIVTKDDKLALYLKLTYG